MNILLITILMTTAPQSEEPARSLYHEGSTLFEAADYEGAIEKFTEALSLVGDEDQDDMHVRLTLLFNIASAHVRQYEIDQDVEHLRQALALFRRYKEFTQKHGDLGEELDIEARLSRVEHMLAEVEEADEVAPTPAPVEPEPEQSSTDEGLEWQKARKTGTGLVVAGSLATVGGAVLAVVGSRLEPRARGQVDELADMGVPFDHPAWQEGDEFIAQQQRQGTVMIGAGVAVSLVGLVGVGVGSYYLVKSKKLREHEVSIAPAWGSGTAGIQIGGRF
jgi:tetratricopeptide (TPR) repeat protein